MKIYNLMSTLWVPTILTAFQKQQRVESCEAFLVPYRENSQKVLKTVVTSNISPYSKGSYRIAQKG